MDSFMNQYIEHRSNLSMSTQKWLCCATTVLANLVPRPSPIIIAVTLSTLPPQVIVQALAKRPLMKRDGCVLHKEILKGPGIIAILCLGEHGESSVFPTGPVLGISKRNGEIDTDLYAHGEPCCISLGPGSAVHKCPLHYGLCTQIAQSSLMFFTDTVENCVLSIGNKRVTSNHG